MAMFPASNSTSVITHAIITKTAERGLFSLAQVKKSSSEPTPPMLPLLGENSSTTADNEVSIAHSSGMKVRTYRPSLSDKLTQSLIMSGLVRGITPSSTRRQLGAPIRVIASFAPGGVGAAKPKTD
jgi:hypothetical protein